MPCNDVTEVLTLRFDAQERLSDYALAKRTCGRAVGELSLVLPWAGGMSAPQLLAADIDSFLAAHPCADEAEEFLHLKHLFALKLGVAVYLGHEPGAPADACATEALSYSPEGSEYVGQVRVEVLTEKIKGCGRCGKACGTRPDVKAATAAGE